MELLRPAAPTQLGSDLVDALGDDQRRSVDGLGEKIPQWSIEHPYVVAAFYFAMVVLAVLAVGLYMPRRFAPYVPSPMVGVVTMMPGLSAQEMELYVSKPIEEQLINVKDLHYIRSTSQDGFSIVTLEFNYGVEMKKAFFKKIADDLHAQLNVRRDDVVINLVEGAKENWSFGGGIAQYAE